MYTVPGPMLKYDFIPLNSDNLQCSVVKNPAISCKYVKRDINSPKAMSYQGLLSPAILQNNKSSISQVYLCVEIMRLFLR